MCDLLKKKIHYLIFLITVVFAIAENESNNPNCVIAPRKCPNENVTFYLYTSYSKYTPVQLNIIDTTTIKNSNFIENASIKFIFHGYTGYRDYPTTLRLRSAYFENSLPVNILVIDYKNLVPKGCYIQAVLNTKIVANCSAQFIDTILDIRKDIKLEQFHLIGLSLGAQVAGQIYNYLRHGILKRITGLDPALPLFYDKIDDPTNILTNKSAKLVDVIHTNSGFKGKFRSIGHIDFYANLGTFQPGCGYNMSCSHLRSAVYYAESINSKTGFWGFNCTDLEALIFGKCRDDPVFIWNIFGEYVNPKLPGNFFFNTYCHPPFAIGWPDSLE